MISSLSKKLLISVLCFKKGCNFLIPNAMIFIQNISEYTIAIELDNSGRNPLDNFFNFPALQATRAV